LSLQHPESSIKELYSCREEQLEELSEDLEERFAELNEILKEKASRDDIKKIEQLKPAQTWNSKFWDKANKGAIGRDPKTGLNFWNSITDCGLSDTP